MRGGAGPVVAAVALALAGGAAAASPAVMIAAHRGGAALGPENSLLAFRHALGLGVDFVEFDVHLTADGEVVVIHDPTLDRTTTGRGPVGAARLGDLQGLRLRAGDGAVTDEPLPTLAALLDLLEPSGARLLLEIKVGAGLQPYPGIEDKVLALVRARGLLERTVIMAFEPDTLRRVRAREPGVRTSLLVGRRRVAAPGVTPAAAVGWATEVGATDLGLDHRVVDAGVVAAARRAGVRLAAWTVNEEADVRRVIDLGVAVVISDRPDLVRRVLGR